MPQAEYNRTGEYTVEEVRDAAASAAESVWSECAVLVTKADGHRAWHNLKKAN